MICAQSVVTKRSLSLIVLLVVFVLFNPTESFVWRSPKTDDSEKEGKASKAPSTSPRITINDAKIKDTVGLVNKATEDVRRAKNQQWSSKPENYTMTGERRESYYDVPLDMVSDNRDPMKLAGEVTSAISDKLIKRMGEMFKETKTPECRKNIAEAFSEYIGAIGGETPLPYTKHKFRSECTDKKSNAHSNDGSNGVMINDSSELKILYLIMTHNKPQQTIRLVRSLEDVGHTFIIHVDAKPSSDATQEALKEYYSDHPLVHVLPNEFRVSVNWGAFGVVQSTLSAIKYAFGIGRPGAPFDFHKVVNMASTSYPLKSNEEIRNTISSVPLDTNLVEIRPQPNKPSIGSWHYYLECDDKVHRIYRMPQPLGVDMYVGSQWFLISREFALHLVDGTSDFVQEYLDYGSKVVVADENFFATVLKNTKYCQKHVNNNHLHLQFDDWENHRKKEGERDKSKCLQPNPNHCGRSPTTMTVDYLPVLQLADTLFARKFNDDVDTEILDIVDRQRVEGTQEPYRMFDGGDVLIVRKDTVEGSGKSPQCLTRTHDGKRVRVMSCFGKDPEVGWEKDTVEPEAVPDLLRRWTIGPCSTDGNVTYTSGECVSTTKGSYGTVGPTCRIQGANGHKHHDMCLDVEGENKSPGGDFLMYACTGRWNQYFSFGTKETKDCSIHLNVPSHLVKSKENVDIVQPRHLCVNGGNNSTRVKTSNCVAGDEASALKERPGWFDEGNEWLLVPVSGPLVKHGEL